MFLVNTNFLLPRNLWMRTNCGNWSQVTSSLLHSNRLLLRLVRRSGQVYWTRSERLREVVWHLYWYIMGSYQEQSESVLPSYARVVKGMPRSSDGIRYSGTWSQGMIHPSRFKTPCGWIVDFTWAFFLEHWWLIVSHELSVLFCGGVLSIAFFMRVEDSGMDETASDFRERVSTPCGILLELCSSFVDLFVSFRSFVVGELKVHTLPSLSLMTCNAFNPWCV